MASRPCSISAPGLSRMAGPLAPGGGVGPLRRRQVVQYRLQVEHLHQARAADVIVEPGDAGHQGAAAGAALGRHHAIPVEPHDLFDRFDRERLGGAGKLGDQHDVQSGRGEATGNRRQVEHLNDCAAQMHHAEHVRPRSGDGGHFRHGDDLADLEDVDAEQLVAFTMPVAAEPEQQQFEFVGAGQGAVLVVLYWTCWIC